MGLSSWYQGFPDTSFFLIVLPSCERINALIPSEVIKTTGFETKTKHHKVTQLSAFEIIGFFGRYDGNRHIRYHGYRYIQYTGNRLISVRRKITCTFYLGQIFQFFYLPLACKDT